MPIQVVTGPPFSGKGQFVRDEIARREADGELGLVALDWTALYTALVPGAESALRDDAVADTGAPRLAGYAFEVIAAAMAARQLRGYVVTQSPRRALELADRFTVDYVLNVPADVGDIAERAQRHVFNLRRTVARAAQVDAIGRCRKAALAYLAESPQLVGRAREVHRSGQSWRTGEVTRPFDRALWERGLTPKGRQALAEMVGEGVVDPTPSEVLSRLLREKRRGF